MTVADPSLTIGIEEEYLLVDPTTRRLISEAPPGLVDECVRRCRGQATPEFLQSQVEIGTRVCSSIQEARDELVFLRKTVGTVAQEHGLAMIAASAHPCARRHSLKQTQKRRYQLLSLDLQAVARRLVISGMHVHVGVPDEDLRVEMMSQATYFLPHLLALSTSSPFWEGDKTGLMSYRIAVWDALPRTGLPKNFDSFGEYCRHIDALVGAGLIEDASKIWWDLRPSARFPTLEMRITDMCTRVEDAICIAAWFRCWLRMIWRMRRHNMRWRRYSNMLIAENRWLAQRHGFEEGLVDFGVGAIKPFSQLIEEALVLVREDAEALNCVAEVEHARVILDRGTSAHWQRHEYEEAMAGGASHEEALERVVDMLIKETDNGHRSNR